MKKGAVYCMKWYRKLYLGDNAKKARYKVLGLIRTGRFQKDTFLIMLPSNPDNLLDVVQAGYVFQPHFKKKMYWNDLYVVGLAKGKAEANEVVRTIVDEVYRNTGGFNIREYLGFGKAV